MKFTKEVVEAIKKFINNNVINHPNDLSRITVQHFGITKPSATKFINELIKDNILKKTGKGRYPNYQLKKSIKKSTYKVSKQLSEDEIWRNDVFPKMDPIKKNIRDICQYGFTEMVNNVIDHSESKTLTVRLIQDYLSIKLIVSDDGIGIFNKIQKAMNLDDPKHSLLELAKGKFTSDPENHTGEGIFFTSKVFDVFLIASQNLKFFGIDTEDWLFEDHGKEIDGTFVAMRISKKSNKLISNIFDEYSNPDNEPGFFKTIVPVKLMQYEGESLLSRSQAKRLIQRFDKFTEVVLDFEGVNIIGQGFADEVFRVFQNAHPKVHLNPINTNQDIDKMISRASKL
ncbi:MAG: DUF4325 domain-containing protein [Desulfobacteraceae bacterium]|nr:DUF4325 domain-containing protein [Desulfobacteraceae bacterium]